jgi:hypothetical protein
MIGIGALHMLHTSLRSQNPLSRFAAARQDGGAASAVCEALTSVARARQLG